MTSVYLLFARITISISSLIPALVWAYNLLKPRIRAEGVDLWAKFAWLVLLAVGTLVVTSWVAKRCAPAIESLSRKQKAFLRALPTRWTSWAIFLSAALSLVLELAVIRWQGTVFELFGFYKNFGLLACFVGLGLGYALAGRRHVLNQLSYRRDQHLAQR